MNLTRSLLEKGRVQTTLAKAKAVQPLVEKLITKSKAATRATLREIASTLADADSYKKLVEMATTRFTSRTSGYTRLVRLGTRKGDASEMVYLEFVDAAPVSETVKPKVSKKGKAVVKDAEVVIEPAKVKTAKKSKTRKQTK